MNFQIISDSSCDLDKSYIQEKGIEVVPFYVSFDGETYYKEGIEIDHDSFYQKMITEHAYPKTSLPSILDYFEIFSKYAKENIPLICICITSKFSGSYQSAMSAKNLVLENHAEAKIEVIDSNINTVLQGIFVREAVRMKENDLSYEETITNLNRIKSTGRIFFTVGSMDYLKHGGRIGKLLSFASNTLGIRPLIILKEGEIFPGGITRSRSKSKQRVIEMTKDHFKKSKENVNEYEFVIGTGIDYKEAEEFKTMMEDALGIKINLPIATIGVTIGSHTGPYPIGIGVLKKYDA